MAELRFRLFVNTDDVEDIVTLEELEKRYTAIHNGKSDGFLDYVLDGCRDDINIEYLPFVIWTAYSPSADITFIMCDDPEDNTENLEFFWGGTEDGTYDEDEVRTLVMMFAKRGIVEKYRDLW